MFAKKIEEPKKLKFLKALSRRLPLNHSKRQLIESDLSKCRAGYLGEQSLEYFFTHFPQKEYLIFHNLRLNNPPHFFQIDFLLLSSKFILILEVKNIAGELFFDTEFNQLIRTIDGKSTAFDCPILQLKNHELHLKSWLRIMDFPDIPIESLVISTNPSSIIKGNKFVATKVIRKKILPDKVRELSMKHQYEKLDPKEYRKISKQLLKHDTPLIPNLQASYQIQPAEILTGVHCPKCSSLPLKHNRGIWECSTCEYKSNRAFLTTLEDYAILISLTITNRKFRNFLHISSPTSASKLLQSLNLSYFGEGKSRAYQLD